MSQERIDELHAYTLWIVACIARQDAASDMLQAAIEQEKPIAVLRLTIRKTYAECLLSYCMRHAPGSLQDDNPTSEELRALLNESRLLVNFFEVRAELRKSDEARAHYEGMLLDLEEVEKKAKELGVS